MMPLLHDLNLTAAATCFAVTGSTVFVALLAVEYFVARWSSRAALIAAVALSLASVVAGLWISSWESAIPLGLLAFGAATLLAARTKLIQRAIVLVTRPVAVMTALLALCLGSAVYVQAVGRMTLSDPDLPVAVGTGFHSVDGLVALTDRGRPLSLIVYNDEESLGEAERKYLNSTPFQHQIIRLKEPTTACNCHGWVYTGGRFAIQSRHVDGILIDNGYEEAALPRADDLVIYRGAEGAIEHTGLVRMVGQDGLILVESKWGPLGVYLHPVDGQPYGVGRKFYRSPRAGHLVSIVPQSSAPQSNLPVLAGLPGRGRDDIDASLSVRPAKPTEAMVYERPILRFPGQHDG